MPATLIKNVPIDNFHQVLDKAIAENQGKDVYVYFYASIDPATGKSWCPDCVAAEPLVQERFAKLDNAVLLEAPTGDRPTWRNPENPYRKDKDARLTSVPTLIHWNAKSKEHDRLVENDCEDVAKLDAFLKL